MAIVKFKPDLVVLETERMVYEETGVDVLDYLCDVEEQAIWDWTDEDGYISIGDVCEAIVNAGYSYIDFYYEMRGIKQ